MAGLLVLPAELAAQDPTITRVTLTPTTPVSLGASVMLRVFTSSTNPPLSFQWQHSETPGGTRSDLAGKTSSILQLTNLTAAQAGYYSVIVSNAAGESALSGETNLVVDQTFTKITTGPIVTDSEPSVSGAWGDYNNDGLLDLFVANSGWNSGGSRNSLYCNLGGDQFERVTNAVTTRVGVSWCGTWGDCDNDGDLDLFVPHPNWAKNELLRNEGGGVFTPMTNALTAVRAYHTDASWIDHDRDGFLDLLVATQEIDGNRTQLNDFFFRNLGDGRFEPWTRDEVGGVVNDQASTFGVAWCDADNDGDLELYVANYYGTGFLYHRVHGTLRMEPRTAGSLPDARASLCAVWGDFNNDGWFDLYATGEAQNTFHLNQGNGQFVDATAAAGLSWSGMAWGAAVGDHDNDGDLDIYMPNASGRDVLYANQGDGTFTSVDVGSPLSEGVSDEVFGWVDYNNDGFLDLFKACGDLNPAVNQLYRNSLPAAGNNNHWLKVQLRGTASNRSAIGARVWVSANIGGQQVRQVRQIMSSCYGGGNMGGLLTHFGLGDATNVTSLQIDWPSGATETFTNVDPNQILTIGEPSLRGAFGSDGKFHLTVYGNTNRSYVVEWSPDLLQGWAILATVPGQGPVPVEVVDDTVPAAQQRFYRLR